jgi:diguanylate cyclase (GGDEF)-like protein
LLPIGGLRTLGYLEIVINPLFNLMDIAQVTQKPLTIYSMQGEELGYDSPIEDLSTLALKEIEYTLTGSDQRNAFHMVLLDDVSEFNRDMGLTRIFALISFITLTIMTIGIALMLMNRYLFKPIHQMIQQMRRVANGDLSIEVDNYGLKDFHELASNFNTMREIVHGNMKSLERMSLLDGLSGIANRRFFDQTLDNEWRRHIRNSTTLSLIICDIDFFKQFNDTYGHLEGDECIQQVAQAVSSSTHRPSDLACRYGGEEFTLILPDTPHEGALHIAELIRQLIARLQIPHKNSSVSPWVTLSLGVATTPLEGVDTPQKLLDAADAALYRAKHSGRNRTESAVNKQS